MEMDKIVTDKQKNYGLSLLRIWMCFEVVLCHFWTVQETEKFNIFLETRNLAVPIFFLMSFLLTGKTMVGKLDKLRVKKRLYRLVCPQIVWSVLYFIVYYLLDLKWNLGLENGIKDFVLQLFFGHTINQTMWYQVDLIIITIIMLCIFGLCKEKTGIFLITILGVLSVYLQYSGWNVATFGNLPREISYPLGRITESVPFVIVGTLISHYNIEKILEKERWKMLIVLLAVIVTMFKVTIFVTPEGFQYSGMYNICMSSAMVMAFYLLPLAKLPEMGKKVIEFVSKYTLGIYCIHRLIRNLMSYLLYPHIAIVTPGTFSECILIFIVSFIVVFLIGKIPVRYFKDAVS